MRAMFGLTGLLVLLGVTAWYMYKVELPYDQQALKVNEQMQKQVGQMAGHDENGVPASASATLDTMESGGKTTALLVTKIAPDGQYAKYFGLQRDDAIVGIEYQGFRQNMKDFDDPEMAKAQVMEAFQKFGSIYVKRGNQEIKLPQAKVAEQSQANGNTPAAAENKSTQDRALAPIQQLLHQGQ